MSKMRIYYAQSDCMILGSPVLAGEIVAVEHSNIHEINDYAELPLMDGLSSLQTKIVHDSEIPNVEDSSQLYIENNQIMTDLTFQVRPKSQQIIKKEYIQAQKNIIENELNNSSPDSVAILRAKKNLEDCESFTEIDWYSKEVEIMDSQGSQNQTVRNALLAKINLVQT